MRKKLGCLTLLGVLTLSMLTGCGSSSSSTKGLGDSIVATNSEAIILDDYSMDYSSTYIDSSYADYSYTFYASGEHKKSKDEMLKDFEDVQALVKDRDGYIENVNNSYNVYDKDRRYYSDSHKTSGRLSFTIQVGTEYVDEVINKLDEICKKNNLEVTTYTQKITNFEGKKIVDHDTDYYDYNTISKTELEQRLKYADISVQLSYYTDFNVFEKFFMGVGNALKEFWESFGELIQIILVLLIIAWVFFFNVCLFYKVFRKMIYKHSKKHPELYEPKAVVLVEPKVETKKGLKNSNLEKVELD